MSGSDHPLGQRGVFAPPSNPPPLGTTFFRSGQGLSPAIPNADVIRRNFAALVRASPAPMTSTGLPLSNTVAGASGGGRGGTLFAPISSLSPSFQSNVSPAQPLPRRGGLLHPPQQRGTPGSGPRGPPSVVLRDMEGPGLGNQLRTATTGPSPSGRLAPPPAPLFPRQQQEPPAPTPTMVSPVRAFPSLTAALDVSQLDPASIHHRVQLVRWRVEVVQQRSGSAGPGGAPQVRVVGMTRATNPEGQHVETPFTSLMVAGWLGNAVVWDEAPTLVHLAGTFEGVTVPWEEAEEGEGRGRIARALQDYFVQGFPQNWRDVVWAALTDSLEPIPTLMPPEQGPAPQATPAVLSPGSYYSLRSKAAVAEVAGAPPPLPPAAPEQPTGPQKMQGSRAGAGSNEKAPTTAPPAAGPPPKDTRLFRSMDWEEHVAPDGEWSLRLVLEDDQGHKTRLVSACPSAEEPVTDRLALTFQSLGTQGAARALLTTDENELRRWLRTSLPDPKLAQKPASWNKLKALWKAKKDQLLEEAKRKQEEEVAAAAAMASPIVLSGKRPRKTSAPTSTEKPAFPPASEKRKNRDKEQEQEKEKAVVVTPPPKKPRRETSEIPVEEAPAPPSTARGRPVRSAAPWWMSGANDSTTARLELVQALAVGPSRASDKKQPSAGDQGPRRSRKRRAGEEEEKDEEEEAPERAQGRGAGPSTAPAQPPSSPEDDEPLIQRNGRKRKQAVRARAKTSKDKFSKQREPALPMPQHQQQELEDDPYAFRSNSPQPPDAPATVPTAPSIPANDQQKRKKGEEKTRADKQREPQAPFPQVDEEPAASSGVPANFVDPYGWTYQQVVAFFTALRTISPSEDRYYAKIAKACGRTAKEVEDRALSGMDDDPTAKANHSKAIKSFVKNLQKKEVPLSLNHSRLLNPRQHEETRETLVRQYVREREYEELAQDLGLGAIDTSDPLAAEIAGEAIKHFEQRREDDAYALNLKKKLAKSMSQKKTAPAMLGPPRLNEATKALTALEKGLHHLGRTAIPGVLIGEEDGSDEEEDSREGE